MISLLTLIYTLIYLILVNMRNVLKGAPIWRALVRIISGPSFKWFERQFLRGVDRGEDSQNPVFLMGF